MEFQSVNKPGLCLDDGGGWGAGDSTAHLWECDPGNMNQWFVTNPDTMMFHNPAKPGLCFDDTGATEAGKSNFIMWYCNPDTPNQQFEVVPQWELLGTVPDVAPPPLPKIDDGPWTVIDNGDDDIPPQPIDDALPPVVVNNDGVVVEPTPPSGDDGNLQMPTGMAQPVVAYNPGVRDGGIVILPPDLVQPVGPTVGKVTAYYPPGPSLEGGFFTGVSPTDNGGEPSVPLVLSPDLIQPLGKYNPTAPGVGDGGIMMPPTDTIPPVGEDTGYVLGKKNSGFVQHTESTAALENTPAPSSGLTQASQS
ncbi:unnamed protein product [Phytophthora fragariaefolia]|uniref:Unnamed protein product n=1 Tax=Phytophthora fragariaefolia TaxID=1490495 RepID=A0A9W6YKG3_9STRA|nr:unnamed protein product [Phytophthora fragariaefolia]